MKKYFFALILISVLVISGCNKTENNTQIANPASEKCIVDGGKLDIETSTDGSQSGVCTLKDGSKCDEWSYYRGECKLNQTCETCPLLSQPSPDFCKGGTIIEGKTNSCGCKGPPQCSKTTNINNNATLCTAEQRGQVACTMDYNPVCGWFNESIKCFAYPCAQTYGNACGACADGKVAYYTKGECPTVGTKS
jgi:putative hemolysin